MGMDTSQDGSPGDGFYMETDWSRRRILWSRRTLLPRVILDGKADPAD